MGLSELTVNGNAVTGGTQGYRYTSADGTDVVRIHAATGSDLVKVSINGGPWAFGEDTRDVSVALSVISPIFIQIQVSNYPYDAESTLNYTLTFYRADADYFLAQVVTDLYDGRGLVAAPLSDQGEYRIIHSGPNAILRAVTTDTTQTGSCGPHAQERHRDL